MQYGNPYFAQPFQQIQPYQDRLAQLQNSYQQTMPYGQAQIQQPIQQMPQVPQIPMLQGQMVDGIDTVKAICTAWDIIQTVVIWKWMT